MTINVNGLLSAATSLLADSGGAALTLGGIGFDGFEVPEKMPFGGQQQLVVHKLPGGGRVVHAMGPDDRNIEWTGYFRGPQAVPRARQVDALRNKGAAISLTWADFTRRVVIQTFECDYTKGGFLLPYKLSCVVIPQAQTVAKPSFLQGIAKDLGDSLGITGLATQAQAAISQAQRLMPVVGALTSGSSTFVALSSGLGSAQAVVGGVQTAAEGQLSGLATAATAAGSVFGGAGGLSAGADAAQAMATASAAGGLLSRAAANLGRVGT